ncbi:MAG TPA: hypothetical protein GX521_05050 [Firmicutes bacterium]|nr:hypothetical protein [Bacillota bacterium]
MTLSGAGTPLNVRRVDRFLAVNLGGTATTSSHLGRGFYFTKRKDDH